MKKSRVLLIKSFLFTLALAYPAKWVLAIDPKHPQLCASVLATGANGGEASDATVPVAAGRLGGVASATGSDVSITQDDLVAALQTFNATLWAQLVKAKTSGAQPILSVSGLGLAVVLHMAAQGAQGHSATELLKALGLEQQATKASANSVLKALQSPWKALLGSLRQIEKLGGSDGSIPMISGAGRGSASSPRLGIWAKDSARTSADAPIFRLANKMVTAPDFFLLPGYNQAVGAAFDASAEVIDLTGTGGVSRLNNWVKEATGGMIQSLFEQPQSSRLAMLLLNALYFKADWTRQFDVNNSHSANFYSLQGGLGQTVMMGQVGLFENAEDGDGNILVKLPFVGERLVFLAAMPGASLRSAQYADWLASFTPAKAWTLASNARSSEVSLRMPRFSFGQEHQFKEILQVLGLHDVFSARDANFSTISAMEQLFIDSVLQKLQGRVDESGAEMAALSSVHMARSMGLQTTKIMNFDRPFVWFVVDQTTGVTLFNGAVLSAPETPQSRMQTLTPAIKKALKLD